MYIAIYATEQQKVELIQKGFVESVNVEWISEENGLLHSKANAIFNLCFNDENIEYNKLIDGKPVFVNAVNCTCKEIGKKNYVRLNAWNGFLNRSIIELAAWDERCKQTASEIFNKLNWKFVWAPDDYGLIAARIIAMIINEAYYALQENVSTKEQIDTAMKLGTNYPYGPFEWSQKIGLKNIYTLLQKLASQNKRYTIADALKAAITNR